MCCVSENVYKYITACHCHLVNSLMCCCETNFLGFNNIFPLEIRHLKFNYSFSVTEFATALNFIHTWVKFWICIWVQHPTFHIHFTSILTTRNEFILALKKLRYNNRLKSMTRNMQVHGLKLFERTKYGSVNWSKFKLC